MKKDKNKWDTDNCDTIMDNEEKIIVWIDSDKIVDIVENNYGRIDKIIRDVNETLSLVNIKNDITEFFILVEWIQKILSERNMGISENLDFILENEAESVLKTCGLEIHRIPLEERRINNIKSYQWKEYYEIKTSHVVDEMVVDLPAILRCNRVVKYGEIRIPSEEGHRLI